MPKGSWISRFIKHGPNSPIHYTVNIDGKGVDVAPRIIPESESK